MKWLKGHQNLQICLVGDDELTIGRDWCVQMLYEFNIMSIFMPNIMDLNMTPEYISKSSCLSFDVPSIQNNRRLKGLNVTFKYTLTGDDWVWFAKISTVNGVDLMYNPKVFGKPEFGKVGLWLSYWPIGNMLNVGDKVHVSIIAMTNGFELMEVGRLTPGWFRNLVGDSIDVTKVRGWRQAGRPQLPNPSITELKTLRFANSGVYQEDIYKIAERVKSHVVDKQNRTPTPSHPKSDVRNKTGKNKQTPLGSVRTTSAVDLEELCGKHYKKLLPIMADKYEYEKRKKEKLEEVKARLDFGDARKKSTRAQESTYSESRTISPRRQRRSRSPRHNPSLFTRLRRERSRSPRHEYKSKERRESTVFKRLRSRDE
ncbi:hypothetical protein Tco_0070641 [Tanacetum coccineum]